MKKKKLLFSPNFFEKDAWKQNLFVCGIDEVGRGCLAGPVIVAAVIMPCNSFHNFIQDSKKMSQQKREEAYEWITKNCQYALASACHKNIDQNNIYQATKQTIKKAYCNISEKIPFSLQKIKYVLIDAMPLTIEKKLSHPDLEVHSFNYGESISSSIAAASIVAKVTRDRLMEKMDMHFPQYMLKKHKGYATKIHCESLKKNGSSLIHRNSFLSNFKKAEASTPEAQQSLFGQS